MIIQRLYKYFLTKKVFILQHIRIINCYTYNQFDDQISEDEDDVKFIGVYNSYKAALAAIERLKHLPGFQENPQLFNDDNDAGFIIEEYTVNKDHWTEGFITEDKEDS